MRRRSSRWRVFISEAGPMSVKQEVGGAAFTCEAPAFHSGRGRAYARRPSADAAAASETYGLDSTRSRLTFDGDICPDRLREHA